VDECGGLEVEKDGRMDGLKTEREYGPADGFGADKAGFVVGATIKGDCAVVETVGAETFCPEN
jgi:hypothetical protein